jgi:hypothetical protein
VGQGAADRWPGARARDAAGGGAGVPARRALPAARGDGGQAGDPRGRALQRAGLLRARHRRAQGRRLCDRPGLHDLRQAGAVSDLRCDRSFRRARPAPAGRHAGRRLVRAVARPVGAPVRATALRGRAEAAARPAPDACGWDGDRGDLRRAVAVVGGRDHPQLDRGGGRGPAAHRPHLARGGARDPAGRPAGGPARAVQPDRGGGAAGLARL